MKSLSLFLAWFLLTTFPILCYAGVTQQHWNQFLSDYSKQVKSKLKEKSVPGAALSITHIDFGSYSEGIGKTRVRKGKNVDENTRFRLASVSKTFAGSLTAKLVSEGRLSLDTPVAEFVPKLLGTPYSDLKVYHLLSHSSGLVPNAYDNLVESKMPYEQIVDRLLEVDRLCQPSRCYGYQNVMFSLIAEVIYKATSISYERWLNDFIFGPLNMKNAGVGLEHMQMDSNFAAPHVKGRKRWHTVKVKPHYYKVNPAAGVNVSASDMSKWLQAQLGMFPSVLSLDALTIQARPYTLTKRELRRRIWREKMESAHYGLGWRVYHYDNTQLLYHSGWVQGYRTDVVVIPEFGVGFSILLNAESGVINHITTEFIEQVTQFVKKHQVKLSKEELEQIEKEEKLLIEKLIEQKNDPTPQHEVG